MNIKMKHCLLMALTALPSLLMAQANGKLNSTDYEKEADAFAFAKKYRDDIPSFMKYISESDFSVVGSYPQSWQYISEGLHSLERHTNFGLCFQTEVP